MLLDAKAKVARHTEVICSQLVLTHLQSQGSHCRYIYNITYNTDAMLCSKDNTTWWNYHTFQCHYRRVPSHVDPQTYLPVPFITEGSELLSDATQICLQPFSLGTCLNFLIVSLVHICLSEVFQYHTCIGVLLSAFYGHDPCISIFFFCIIVLIDSPSN